MERLHAEAATRAGRLQEQAKQLAVVQEEVPQLRDRLRQRAEDEERRWQSELRRVQDAIAAVNTEREAVASSAKRLAAQQEALREKEEEVEEERYVRRRWWWEVWAGRDRRPLPRRALCPSRLPCALVSLTPVVLPPPPVRCHQRGCSQGEARDTTAEAAAAGRDRPRRGHVG